jgi:biotin carboxylase
VAAAGLAVPLGVAFADPAAAGAWYVSNGLGGAVVKPPRSTGSDNVWFCGDRRQVDVCAQVPAADLYGEHNGSVLVQKRLAGTKYYVKTVSHDGVHRVVELWRYTKRGAASGRSVYDFEQPVPVNCPQGDAVRRFVPLVLGSLGIVTGAAHTEIMATGRGPVLIESGARLGGGTLPWVVEKLCGVSQNGLPADALVNPAAVSRFDERGVRCTVRLGEPRIVGCDGPHEAMLTHPEEVARALVTAGRD